VANVASVLLINAPTGLTRYLARHRGDRHLQEAYLSNWVVAILGVVVLSLAVAAPIAPLLGLHGGMVLGTLAVILGVSATQTYIQILTGLERFARMTMFWLAANVVQLIAVLDAALLGFRDPAVFLACYGLSGVLALLVFQLIEPLGLRVSLRAINRERMGVVWRYTLPLLFANAFVTVWLGCDLALVERMRSATEGGVYASAKTLGQALNLAPQAIATAVLPGMSGLSSRAAGAFLKRAIALIVAVQAPAVLIVALIGGPIAAFVFGGDYARAGTVLPLVATGMGLYGVFSVVESAWLGLGRTLISTIAAFLGMVCTLGLGLVLVPSMGGVGAGIAFAAGGLVAVCVLLGRIVIALMGIGPHRGVGHVEDRGSAASSAVGS
jgi:O-antigen/teichoic acid export membrane protein